MKLKSAVLLPVFLFGLSGCATHRYGDVVSCPRYSAVDVIAFPIGDDLIRVLHPDRSVQDISAHGCVITYGRKVTRPKP